MPLPDVDAAGWQSFEADSFGQETDRRIDAFSFTAAADQRLRELQQMQAAIPPPPPQPQPAPMPQNPPEAIEQPTPTETPYSALTSTPTPSSPLPTSYSRPDRPVAPPLASLQPGGQDLVADALNAADRYQLDPHLFTNLIRQESNFNPTARSPVGAIGLGQLMPATARGLGVTDPNDPTQNLDAAARYLRQNLDLFDGDVPKALAAYNAGPGAVQKYGGIPPYAETQKYVDTIMSRVAQEAIDTSGITGGTGTYAPGPTEGVARAGAALAASPGRDVSQFGDPQLTADEAYAACGPAAAVRFAQRYGRNPTLREALDLAKTVGWTAQQGMAGLASEKQLMDKLPDPVPTKLVQGAQWDVFAKEAATGNPVIISTAGHYFSADGYNADTGKFHVGKSGLDLKRGAEWMSPAQMTSLMGEVQGGLLADNPQVPQPSTADQDTNPLGWLGRQKDALLGSIGDTISSVGEAKNRFASSYAQGQKELADIGLTTGANPLETFGGAGLGVPTSGEQLTEQRNRAVEQANPLRDVPVLGGASTFAAQTVLDPTNLLFAGEPAVARTAARGVGAAVEAASTPEVQALLRARQRAEGINPLAGLQDRWMAIETRLQREGQTLSDTEFNQLAAEQRQIETAMKEPASVAPAAAAPEPTAPANPFALQTEPAPGLEPITVDDVAAHIETLTERYTTNNDRIQELETRIGGGVYGAGPSVTGVVRPPWAVGWTDDALRQVAQQHDVNPNTPDWWEKANLFGTSRYRLSNGREVVEPPTGEFRENVGQGGLRGTGTARGSATDARAELARLQAEQEQLLSAADSIASMGDQPTYYRPAVQKAEDLPWIDYNPPSSAIAEPSAASPAATAADATAADTGGRGSYPQNAPGSVSPAPAASSTAATAPVGRTRQDIYNPAAQGGYVRGETWVVDPDGSIRLKPPEEKVIDRRDPGANTPYFAVQRRGDGTAYIGEMYVPESMRNQGLGARMYEHMANWAADNGYTLISGSDRTGLAESALRSAERKGLVSVIPSGEVDVVRPGAGAPAAPPPAPPQPAPAPGPAPQPGRYQSVLPAGTFTPAKPPPASLTQQLDRVATFVTQQLTDRDVQLAKVQQQYGQAIGRPLQANEMVYELKRLAADPVAEVRVDQGLRPALQSVGSDYEALRDYVTLRSNVQVADALGNDARLFSGNVSKADSQQALQLLEQQLGPDRFARVKAAADDVSAFSKDLRKRLVDSGVLSLDQAAQMETKYPDWVKTRILDYMKDASGGQSAGSKIGLSSRDVHAYTQAGTARAREDPLASTVAYAYNVERMARKNEAFSALRTVDQAGPVPQLRRVPSDFAPTKDQVTVVGFENGQKVKYVTDNKALGEAINGAGVVALPEWATAWQSIFRSLATSRNPVFLAGNAALDIPEYVLRSSVREGSPLALPKILGELARGYGDAFQGLLQGEYRGASTSRFLLGGGGQAGYFTGGEGRTMQAIGDLRRSNVFAIQSKGDLGRLLKDLVTLRPVEALGERIELGPRVAAMRLAERRGANPVQAVIEGRTVTIDFSQGGQLTKFVNQFAPFFNVGWQGPVQVARSFRENPRAWLATVGTLLGVPTIGAEAWNRSDPQRAQDYADVPQYLKNQGIVVMVPGEAPLDPQGNRKPQFVWINARNWSPFVVAAREAAARVVGDNSHDWQDVLGNVGQGGLPIQASNPADFAERLSLSAPGIGAAAQLALNKDFFRGSDIVTHRADQNASAAAKALTPAFQQMVDQLGVNAEIRPSAIDFVIRNQGAGVGAAALGASDLALGAPPKGSGPQNLPVAGGLVGRFVRNQTGQTSQQARGETLTPSARAILRANGITSTPTPVQGEYDGVPFLVTEEARYQQLVNRYIDEAVHRAPQASDWGKLSEKGRQARLQDAMDAARQKAGFEVLKSIPTAEKVRRRQTKSTAPNAPAAVGATR